ncbi:hypothetical protein Klosneuvirus_1_121 [Klosneuvirus KNV1]|uniref:Uncharacterized protein n=1 Tax=Klosneuvirus KNV1 TaxID=1977640 RepID=A0A1V0SHZ8_9VIRU|nr:hypothetical protein Klosneuvirus_1_121 [Klosneuvirus KNV1]
MDKETTSKIILYGTYYKPAYFHYKDKNVKVNCDRCHKNDLKECYGLAEYDLYISCIKECLNIIIDEHNEKYKRELTFMEQTIFNPYTRVIDTFPRDGFS